MLTEVARFVGPPESFGDQQAPARTGVRPGDARLCV